MTRRALIACLSLSASCAALALEPSVVPAPASTVRGAGELRLHDGAVIAVSGGTAARRVAEIFAARVARTHRVKLEIAEAPPRAAAIEMRVEPIPDAAPESYRLSVRPGGAVLTAATAQGLAHGASTLWQLATIGRGEARLPAVQIDDAPRFAWRGLLLDSARHYQSPAFIRDYLDWMALHKLNVLHWHLADDQAWRLEIRKYPRLAEVGGWRVPAGPAAAADIDPATGKPRLYGGVYSQQEARELVAYAAERGITIVPEIEMPGHASAAIVAYPALASTSTPPTAVSSDWGVFPHAYNLDEATFGFLEDVLREVMAVFPSAWIHVGGDEVDTGEWKSSPRVQARMKELGIADAAQVQAYFTQRVAKFLQANGRRLVGWDEILEPGLAPGAVVMSWRGVDGALGAAAKGHDTVIAAHPTLYFDNRQGAGLDEPPGRGRIVSLKDVYDFDPMPPSIAPDRRAHVLGIQGNVWTEHIRTEPRVAWMTFPRAAAIAESGWSQPQHRDWPGFARRVAALASHYAALGLEAADSAFAPEAARRYDARGVTVELATQAGVGEIRYTTDGSEPTASSRAYRAPLRLALPASLRAATFDGAQRISRVHAFDLRREGARRRASRELDLCSHDIDLALEDDAPLAGARAVFLMDVQRPCWIFRDARLDGVSGVVASVGQVPFNFQIGEDVKKIRFARPATAAGELEVHLGTCEGELLARLPLAPAAASLGVTALPATAMRARPGVHDLCMRFAQPGLDPLWALDAIELVGARR